MDNLTVVIPYWNGEAVLCRLLETIPEPLPIIVVDDCSDMRLHGIHRGNGKVIGLERRGYFSGAVNAGIKACNTDVLVLNQDVYFTDERWLDLLGDGRKRCAMLGEGIVQDGHPYWPSGYIHGTFMFLRRDAIKVVGGLNAELYPLWGSTCLWQLQVIRRGFTVEVLPEVPGLVHTREKGMGNAMREALRREPHKRGLFLRTPPEMSVILPFSGDINKLCKQIDRLMAQTFQSFEIIILHCGDLRNEAVRRALSLVDDRKGIAFLDTSVHLEMPIQHNDVLRVPEIAQRRKHGKHITVAPDVQDDRALEKLWKER